ncbi:MAG: response regulator [Candidatus Omnitrophica bacterium]|nr:response regulator [Candidatus Omnitrophota bacterium]
MKKKKILLVDDEPAFTRAVKVNLQSRYNIRIENQGSRVFDAVRDFGPDLILMDIMMPDMDGCEAARKLRDSFSFRNTPIVFVTALVTRNETADKKTKVNDYPCIAKPATPEDLMACIEANLQ